MSAAQNAGVGSSTGTRAYNAGIDSAVSGNYKLPSCVVGAVELLTYFPNHLMWPDIIIRLYRAGFRYLDMALAQLDARDTLDADELRRRHNAIRYQMITAGKQVFGINFNGPSQAPYSTDPRLLPFSAAEYPAAECPNGVMEHYDVSEAAAPRTQTGSRIHAAPATLFQVGYGVENAPTGSDAGIVTKVMIFAEAKGWVDNNGRQYTTDDIPTLAALHGFTLPGEAYTINWDKNGLTQCQTIDKP